MGTDDDYAVWAPNARQVILVLDRTDPGREAVEVALHADLGWWRLPDDAPEIASEVARYGYRIDDDPTVLPDPRSPRQPDGVHRRSAPFDAGAFDWSDSAWTGRSVAGAVLYELHIGTFTAPGTFDSAIERLDHLVALGVQFVEVMPINAFNGTHNWGYDGVGWYAVHENYGGPAGFQRFVDACHRVGIGVILDVVYNHLGPSGNYLPRFGPYLTDGANTWGQSLNLDRAQSDPVRAFVIDNAVRWMRDFHVDGLRLDAVHALVDATAVHLLEELAIRTEALSTELGRPLSLIAESDLNDPRLVTARSLGGYGLTAQWDDDVHHAIHTAVSGERQGYYSDFGSFECLATVLTGGFFHAMTYSSFRRRRHGRPIDPDRVPSTAMVVYTCNHDQIGNRAVGDRPTAYLDDGQVAIKAALVLTSAFTPMLFMGEEWGARTPFQFFTSHPEPELGRATADGRKAEFADHGWAAADVPDPQDRATFERSHLDWSELDRGEHRRILEFYRALIALREDYPQDLRANDFRSTRVEFDSDAGWFIVHRGSVVVACVLGSDPARIPVDIDPLLSWVPVRVGADGIDSPGHNVVIGRRSGEVAVGR
ncbi:malto-oligosyltrehalose trehalohydrolase [Williamsia sp. CHRR-6]|uniref:malto-oligosyltrehalose trehalohydrolase n=1 Tax=Williamsia sp. CHRR-6 TaxID=2835871 RepID=UPI001BD97319|nr:malto-oligosyltrehalose trehalohydrolase [Williamsia sp. CHRR-6]MBT0565239.1 malto-oligosyltrehalose trehalohydrolase [Williamsia sp. CHRR-6]